MKRYVSTALIFALIISLFTACIKEESVISGENNMHDITSDVTDEQKYIDGIFGTAENDTGIADSTTSLTEDLSDEKLEKDLKEKGIDGLTSRQYAKYQIRMILKEEYNFTNYNIFIDIKKEFKEFRDKWVNGKSLFKDIERHANYNGKDISCVAYLKNPNKQELIKALMEVAGDTRVIRVYVD